MKTSTRRALVAKNGPSGFSLLELMIGGALIAIAALMGVRLFEQQYSNIKSIEASSEIDLYHRQIRRSLLNLANCNSTFASFYGQKEIGQLSTLRICNGLSSEDCPAPYTNSLKLVGKGDLILNDTFSVENIIGNPTAAAPEGTPLSGTGTKFLVMHIEYERLKKLKAGPNKIKKSLMVNLRFDKNGNFMECFSESAGTASTLQNLVTDTLTDSNAYFDPDEKKLKLKAYDSKNVCTDPLESFSGIGPDGKAICTKIQDSIKLDEFVAGSTSGNCKDGGAVSFSFNQNKKLSMNCEKVTCVPEKSCSVIAAKICTDQSAGFDTCKNECGMGTRKCKSCDCYKRESCDVKVTEEGCKLYLAKDYKCSPQNFKLKPYCQ